MTKNQRAKYLKLGQLKDSNRNGNINARQSAEGDVSLIPIPQRVERNESVVSRSYEFDELYTNLHAAQDTLDAAKHNGMGRLEIEAYEKQVELAREKLDKYLSCKG